MTQSWTRTYIVDTIETAANKSIRQQLREIKPCLFNKLSTLSKGATGVT